MDLLRSLPIGLYLEKPVTWLHTLDARVKFIWLMTFLAAPLLANPWWRLALVGFLMLITLLAMIPFRVWRQQMGWLIFLCAMVFIITALTPDGLAVNSQPRSPDWGGNLPQPTDYNYVLIDRGRLFITRRSLELSVRISTLIFTLIYSTNLFLLTTAPEEITAGLEDMMSPLRRFGLPVTEISLTLTLALRFIPLVLEEVQNLARSIRTRAIDWKKLGFKKSTKVWLTVVEKILDNLLLRAEQIAVAMESRGFTSPDEHRVNWHQLRLGWGDSIALFALVPFWIARFLVGGMD
jgi:energy-coupling factor transport system permease protein